MDRNVPPGCRGFVDFALISFAVKHKRDVVIRCARNGFTVIQEFWNSPDREWIVTLSLPNTPTQMGACPGTRRFVRLHKLPESVQVRLKVALGGAMKFMLPTGETEVILTTLCDADAFPTEEFYTLYGKRWGQETYYESGPLRGHRIKNIFELERFRSGPLRGRGTSEHTIRQDFFGVIFLATLEGALTQPAQTQLHPRRGHPLRGGGVFQAQDEDRQTQTRAKVNRVTSYVAQVARNTPLRGCFGAIVNHVVVLLADTTIPPEQTLEELQQLFQQTPTRHGPRQPGENGKALPAP